MTQILENLKMYITERQEQVQDRWECTLSDYHLGKLDVLEEISNYILGEEMMTMPDDVSASIQNHFRYKTK
jgi:hypothetical protein